MSKAQFTQYQEREHTTFGIAGGCFYFSSRAGINISTYLYYFGFHTAIAVLFLHLMLMMFPESLAGAYSFLRVLETGIRKKILAFKKT